MRRCQCRFNKCSKMSSPFRLQYQIDPMRGTMEPLAKSMHCPCPSPSSPMTLSASTGHAWTTETSSSGCSKLSEGLRAQSSSVGHLLISGALMFSHLRRGKQRGQAALPGVCVLPVETWAAPVPSCAAGRGFSAVAPRDGRGRAQAQGPAGLPVAMQTGTAVTNRKVVLGHPTLF